MVGLAKNGRFQSRFHAILVGSIVSIEQSLFWDCFSFIFWLRLRTATFFDVSSFFGKPMKMNVKQLLVLNLILALIVGGIWLLSTGSRQNAFAQNWGGPAQMPFEIPVQPVPSTWLVSFTVLEHKHVKQVIIVNPEAKRIGVYEVSLIDGSIQYCGMRELTADFQMKVHNGREPLPQQIERQLEQQSDKRM